MVKYPFFVGKTWHKCLQWFLLGLSMLKVCALVWAITSTNYHMPWLPTDVNSTFIPIQMPQQIPIQIQILDSLHILNKHTHTHGHTRTHTHPYAYLEMSPVSHWNTFWLLGNHILLGSHSRPPLWRSMLVSTVHEHCTSPLKSVVCSQYILNEKWPLNTARSCMSLQTKWSNGRPLKRELKQQFEVSCCLTLLLQHFFVCHGGPGKALICLSLCLLLLVFVEDDVYCAAVAVHSPRF